MRSVLSTSQLKTNRADTNQVSRKKCSVYIWPSYKFGEIKCREHNLLPFGVSTANLSREQYIARDSPDRFLSHRL